MLTQPVSPHGGTDRADLFLIEDRDNGNTILHKYNILASACALKERRQVLVICEFMNMMRSNQLSSAAI